MDGDLMGSFDAELLNTIDVRIAQSRTKERSKGTVVSLASQYVYVAMDGDSIALPCKFTSGLPMLPGTRVVLERVGSEWVVVESFAKGVNQGGIHWAEHFGGIATYTGTTWVAGTPEVTVPFVAPPSGVVMIQASGHIWTQTTGHAAILTYEVWPGNVAGAAGATVYQTPVAQYGVITSRVIASGAFADHGGAGPRRPLGGLTPGDEYVARTMHSMSGAGTGGCAYRLLVVEPVL
jgi:hypothetical protein